MPGSLPGHWKHLNVYSRKQANGHGCRMRVNAVFPLNDSIEYSSRFGEPVQEFPQSSFSVDVVSSVDLECFYMVMARYCVGSGKDG